MRTSLVVVGVILLLLGAVWALQGADLLTGSSMSGNSFWLGVGAVLLVVGLAVAALGARSPSRTKTA